MRKLQQGGIVPLLAVLVFAWAWAGLLGLLDGRADPDRGAAAVPAASAARLTGDPAAAGEWARRDVVAAALAAPTFSLALPALPQGARPRPEGPPYARIRADLGGTSVARRSRTAVPEPQWIMWLALALTLPHATRRV